MHCGKCEKKKCIALSSKDVEGYDLRGWTRQQIAKLPRDIRGRDPSEHAIFGRAQADEDDVGANPCQGLAQGLLRLVSNNNDKEEIRPETFILERESVEQRR